MGAAPCRADDRNRDSKKSLTIRSKKKYLTNSEEIARYNQKYNMKNYLLFIFIGLVSENQLTVEAIQQNDTVGFDFTGKNLF